MREEGMQTIEAVDTYIENEADSPFEGSAGKATLQGLERNEEWASAEHQRQDKQKQENRNQENRNQEKLRSEKMSLEKHGPEKTVAMEADTLWEEEGSGKAREYGSENEYREDMGRQEREEAKLADGQGMRKISLFVKRTVDLVGSAVGLLVISPLLVLLIIAIKLDSKGPVFYVQERLGRDGKVFNILKFRTMVTGAEFMGAGLSIDGEDDPRITKVGKFLRATSLDELPQLFNVVKGEMSLVGPRPPLESSPYEGYDSYPEDLKIRFKMRPGITGLSQVTVRTSVPWEERLPLDAQYIREFSLMLDMRILMKTAVRVIGRKDIYAPKKQSGV